MKYSVKKTSVLDFDPTELDIIVGDKFEKEEVSYINVTTILTEKGENSLTQRATNHVFHFSIWQGIVSGYDVEKKEPILDATKLSAILANFKLELI